MGSGTPLDVLLVSERPLILGALQAFFQKEGSRFAVTGAVDSAREAVALSVGQSEGTAAGPQVRPKEQLEKGTAEDPAALVVVLDAAGEPSAGAEAVGTLLTVHPEWRVLALTDGSPASVLAILQAGAIGAISHSSDPAELVEASAATASRELVLGADVQFLLAAWAVGRGPGVGSGIAGFGRGSAGHFESPPAESPVAAAQLSVPITLTEQESEAVRHLLHGLGNRQIAERMFVSASSVKDYLKSARRKLGASNRAHLAVRAFQLGWTPLASE